MRRILVIAAVLCLGTSAGFWALAQESIERKPPKHTIKEVMKEAHGKKLLNKVVDGAASKEEKDQLLDLYISLIDNKPAKGEDGSWFMKSGRLILAAARVSVGREGAEADLKAASDCKGCHEVHK
jgi:hypothetical protein